jgi:hypothetical protein
MAGLLAKDGCDAVNNAVGPTESLMIGTQDKHVLLRILSETSCPEKHQEEEDGTAYSHVYTTKRQTKLSLKQK